MRLDLEGTTGFDEIGAKSIAVYCPKLISLCLVECSDVSVSVLELIGCSKLRTLSADAISEARYGTDFYNAADARHSARFLYGPTAIHPHQTLFRQAHLHPSSRPSSMGASQAAPGRRGKRPRSASCIPLRRARGLRGAYAFGPSPCRGPHPVRHSSIALGRARGRPSTRAGCSRDALADERSQAQGYMQSDAADAGGARPTAHPAEHV